MTIDQRMAEIRERRIRELRECRDTIAQQRADIAALVDLIVAQYGWQCHPTTESTTSALDVKALYDIAQPIIERYRGGE